MPSGVDRATEEFLGGFVSAQRVQVVAICLERAPERWRNCEEHLKAIFPKGLVWSMVPGVDAGQILAGEKLSDIDAVEAALGCRLYRSWPITEVRDPEPAVEDVRTLFPDETEGLDDMQTWKLYELMYRPWPRERARLWVDFYSRHLTVGDIGCSLSHLGLWECHANADDEDVLVVFEDDARPAPDAVTHLLQQCDALQRRGLAWDLVYGHGVLYDKPCLPDAEGDPPASPEEVVPDTDLAWAAHRKVTDFYALSGRGARKLAGCGFRGCIFPVDDFLPAVHARSTHPRADVMRLECVRAVRAQEGGLLAFAVRDEHVRCDSAFRSAGSMSKDSACILGDMGAHVAGTADEGQAGPSPWAVATPLRMPPSQHALHNTREDLVQELALQIGGRDGSWGVVAPTAKLLRLHRDAEEVWLGFFAGGTAAEKRACKGAGGRGGTTGDLTLWGNGWTGQRYREQFHVVHGAWDAQPFPNPQVREASKALTAELKHIAAAIVARLVPQAEVAREQVEAMAGDPSVFDAFYYFNTVQSGDDGAKTAPGSALNMASHVDPGYITIKLTSPVAGLEVWSDGRWVAVEGQPEGPMLVAITAEQLADASGGFLSATWHRIARPTEAEGAAARLSLVFELRTHGTLQDPHQQRERTRLGLSRLYAIHQT